MPLTVFGFEYIYSNPHEISKRSVVVALSTYSFSVAFGTRFRVISIFLIFMGFVAGGMYGSVNFDEKATLSCVPCVFLCILVTLSIAEWTWRHFYENEDCWFYSIFQQKAQQLIKP